MHNGVIIIGQAEWIHLVFCQFVKIVFLACKKSIVIFLYPLSFSLPPLSLLSLISPSLSPCPSPCSLSSSLPLCPSIPFFLPPSLLPSLPAPLSLPSFPSSPSYSIHNIQYLGANWEYHSPLMMLSRMICTWRSRSGRVCSCQNPTTWPNSCTTIPNLSQFFPMLIACGPLPLFPTKEQHLPRKFCYIYFIKCLMMNNIIVQYYSVSSSDATHPQGLSVNRI